MEHHRTGIGNIEQGLASRVGARLLLGLGVCSKSAFQRGRTLTGRVWKSTLSLGWSLGFSGV